MFQPTKLKRSKQPPTNNMTSSTCLAGIGCGLEVDDVHFSVLPTVSAAPDVHTAHSNGRGHHHHRRHHHHHHQH